MLENSGGADPKDPRSGPFAPFVSRFPVDVAPLSCPSEVSGDIVTLHPTGDIDLNTVGIFRDALRRAAEIGRRVIVDLTGVTYIDSTGFRELAVWQRRLRERGRRMALVNPNGPMRKMLRVMGFDALLPAFQSVEEAVSQGDDGSP